MFVVYCYNQEFESWDYQCTLHDDKDVMYALIQLFEEVEHKSDQSELLYKLMLDTSYVGNNLRIFPVDIPYKK